MASLAGGGGRPVHVKTPPPTHSRLAPNTVASDGEVVGAEGVLHVSQAEGGGGQQLVLGAPGSRREGGLGEPLGREGATPAAEGDHGGGGARYSRHTGSRQQEGAAPSVAHGAAHGAPSFQGCSDPFPRRASQGAAQATGQFPWGAAQGRVLF